MKRLLRENWMILLVAGLVVSGYVFLRTPGDDFVSTVEFDAQITAGSVTLVEFYSNT